ncbi:MAG TPA: sensor histidine kinase [Thermoanaerobaculia bacterium]|jgi:signal transduction histidine kinase
MKLLRRLVFANALLLAAAGGTIAFNPPLSLPVRYGLGWVLTLIALAMAAALAWMVRRPLWPAESGIAALSIPDEIRQGLLRQIGESAAQEERNRLARDLHDSIKQQLFSINVGAATAQERWERDPEGARKALADVRRSAREAMVEMQAMLHQLQPKALGTAGLIEALREQCEAVGYRSGAEVALELGEPVPDDRMPPGAAEALFRMAQEMLANVARHARARDVRLWLGRQDEEVILRIEDDGQGFEPAAETSGMGLRNLRARAAALRGRLKIASAPGSDGPMESERASGFPAFLGDLPGLLDLLNGATSSGHSDQGFLAVERVSSLALYDPAGGNGDPLASGDGRLRAAAARPVRKRNRLPAGPGGQPPLCGFAAAPPGRRPMSPEPESIRVALVDDHRVVQSGLRSYLTSFAGISPSSSSTTAPRP